MTDRPLSPHLSIYRFTINMVMSVAHRLSGIGSYFGTLVLGFAFVYAARGVDEYDWVMAWLANPFIKALVSLYIWAIMLHLLGGLRHLLWDHGLFLEKQQAGLLGWLTLFGSVIAAAAAVFVLLV